ncbi:dispanin subfamily A member 2b-like [Scyliorhinus canicula]|uniref:dispanin subfamily A member 2b-like n=1 Tax=Scyliorhinus canicula TaxID=7830 RepID=UPI0018F4CDAE|nr:dispanin subfamily A member 2b-like [Scyliorhinus canicula]
MEYRADQVPMNPGVYPYQGQQQVQSTVITMAPNMPPIRDHLPWSIFNFFYMNCCCLGFVALVFSVKSRDRKTVGDVEGSRQYGSTARTLNIVATVLSVLFILLIIVLAIAGVFRVAQAVHQTPNYSGYPKGWN